MGLGEEDIFLAKIIALLHDIGRFEPVSYTHLDVYKRQLFWMRNNRS